MLTELELASLWQALPGEGFPFGHLVQLLILTGQRRGEVTHMQWQKIDEQSRLWTIPEHILPLSDLAMEVLGSMPRLNDTLVFPARGNDEATVSGFSKVKLRLEAAAGADDWTLHDLRRTTATFLGKLGTAPHVIERILNHVSGSFAGVAGVYNRHPYLDEMRTALQRWADWVRALDR